MVSQNRLTNSTQPRAKTSRLSSGDRRPHCGLARMRKHDAEDMGSAMFVVGCDDWSAGAEVDLGFVPRLTFETWEGELVCRLQTTDKAPDNSCSRSCART